MEKSTEVFAKSFESFAKNLESFDKHLESFDKHFKSSAKEVERPPRRVSEYQIGEAIYHAWLHGLLASAPAMHKAVELVVNNPPSAETKEAQPYLARRIRSAPRSQKAMTMQGILDTVCGLLWSAEECAGVAQICRRLAEVVLAPPEEDGSEAERKGKEVLEQDSNPGSSGEWKPTPIPEEYRTKMTTKKMRLSYLADPIQTVG